MRGLQIFHAPRRRCVQASLSQLRGSNPIRASLPSLTTKPLRPFSTTPQLCKRKNQRVKPDMRITLIRYHLKHPITPRPLRFSRNRSLRHWTIHRAWQLHRSKLRDAREKELEREFNSMREACEALRLIGEDGLAVTQPGNAVPPPGARDLKRAVLDKDGEKIEMDVQAAAERQKYVGRLYRTAMLKTRVWDGVPIEYARAQTDTPPSAGWDKNWTR